VILYMSECRVENPCDIVYECVPCDIVYECVPCDIVYECVPCGIVSECVPCVILYMSVCRVILYMSVCRVILYMSVCRVILYMSVCRMILYMSLCRVENPCDIVTTGTTWSNTNTHIHKLTTLHTVVYAVRSILIMHGRPSNPVILYMSVCRVENPCDIVYE
jgi:hypothetical protein